MKFSMCGMIVASRHTPDTTRSLARVACDFFVLFCFFGTWGFKILDSVMRNRKA